MVSFVHLRNESSRSLGSELLIAGYCGQEARSISEAIWLCTQRHLGVIVIAENFEEADAVQLQSRYLTVRLTPEATIKDILCKLALVLQGELAGAS